MTLHSEEEEAQKAGAVVWAQFNFSESLEIRYLFCMLFENKQGYVRIDFHFITKKIKDEKKTQQIL